MSKVARSPLEKGLLHLLRVSDEPQVSFNSEILGDSLREFRSEFLKGKRKHTDTYFRILLSFFFLFQKVQ